MSFARLATFCVSSTLWLACASGCGDPARGQPPVSAASAPGDRAPAPQATTTQPAVPPGEAADPPLAQTGEPALSRDQCERFLDHFLVLAQARHAQSESAEYLPTPEQIAEIRASMAPDFLRLCQTMDRATYECGMRARDGDEMVRCMPPEQP